MLRRSHIHVGRSARTSRVRRTSQHGSTWAATGSGASCWRWVCSIFGWLGPTTCLHPALSRILTHVCLLASRSSTCARGTTGSTRSARARPQALPTPTTSAVQRRCAGSSRVPPLPCPSSVAGHSAVGHLPTAAHKQPCRQAAQAASSNTNAQATAVRATRKGKTTVSSHTVRARSMAAVATAAAAACSCSTRAP